MGVTGKVKQSARAWLTRVELGAAIRHLQSPLAVIRVHGPEAWRILLANSEFSRVFGKQEHELHGADVRDFFSAPFEDLLAQTQTQTQAQAPAPTQAPAQPGAERVALIAGELPAGAPRADEDHVFLDVLSGVGDGVATVRGHTIEPYRERTGVMLSLVDLGVGLPSGAHDAEVDGEDPVDPTLRLLVVRALSREELVSALGRSRERFRELINDNPDMNYILSPEGEVIEINPAGERLLGYTKAELQEHPYTLHVHDADLARVREHFDRVMNRCVEQFEARLIAKSGDVVTIEALIRPIIEDGEVVGLFGIGRDITERLHMQRRLEESEQRYRSLFEHNIDAVLTCDTAGTFVSVNEATERLLKLPASQLLGRNLSEFIVAARRDDTRRGLASVLAGQPVQFESVMLDGRDTEVELHLSLVPMFIDGEIRGIHGICKDVTHRKRLERQLKQMAFFDQLTGLPNRNSFDTNIARKVTEVRQFALFSIDLDRLKTINDTLGRKAGDRLLKSAAHRLAVNMPPGADLFRYSGDDFLITYDVDEREGCLEFARSLEALLRESVVLGDSELSVSARIGISMYPDDGRDPEILLKKADNAVHAARQPGRNRIAFYRDVSGEGDLRRLQLEVTLSNAIAGGELSLAYHPQIDLASGALHGVEALLRWTHPHLGEVPPSEFIPVAEESGLIHEIGAWVIDAACAQMVSWRNRGLPPFGVAVNISIDQFYDADFADQLEASVRRSGVDPALLTLEITESIASNSEVVVAQLHRFKRIGVRIAIDDFGTGYSSLRYLKDFPVDYLKIDRSFVAQLEQVDDERSLVSTITSLARNFGLETIAEGTETLRQVEIMRQLGANYAQGYFFSRPLSPDALEAWVTAHSAGAAG